MKRFFTINGEQHTLEWLGEWSGGETLSCSLDGQPFEAQAVEIAAGRFSILIAGRQFDVRVEYNSRGSAADRPNEYAVRIAGVTSAISIHDPRRWSRAQRECAREGRQQITAPMPGKVIRILVRVGQPVEPGQSVVVVEAMKMQNEIKSSSAGTVAKVLAAEAQAVNAGEVLMIIE